MKEHRYLSIDLETTGLNDKYCQVLEIGVVIADWETPVEELPTWRCYVDSEDENDGVPFFYGQPYALWLNSQIFRYLAMRPKNEEEALEMGFEEYVPIVHPDAIGRPLAAFLTDNGMDLRDHQTAAGKNFSSFDMQFLKRFPSLKENKVIFRHRAIDPVMYYWRPEDDGNRLPSMDTCMERAGIPGPVPHKAVDDAQIVIKLIRQAKALGLIQGKQIR